MKVLACIPARYGSARFAGKVLAKDTGKFLIQHIYERALSAKTIEKVIIATDSELVLEACKSFGAPCVMTSEKHQSGTDRIAEAVRKLADSPSTRIGTGVERIADGKNKKPYTLSANDIIINLQADEPEIDPANIDYLTGLLLKNKDCPMATLATEFKTAEEIQNPNIVKVAADRNGRAIYFSRSVIPYDREKNGVGDIKQYLRHIGIYAYRKEFLEKITALPQSRLERIEKLEQLRALENGYTILVGIVKHTCDGIDTQEQYAEFVKRCKK